MLCFGLERRHTDADLKLVRAVLAGVELIQVLLQPVLGGFYTAVRRVHQQDGELIAAHAGNDIGVAIALTEEVGHGTQRLRRLPGGPACR